MGSLNPGGPQVPPPLFVDEHLLVVVKPSGLLSVPGRTPALADCLWTRLRQAFPEREVLLVHRLDRDTSGLMVFALTREAQACLGRLFEHRKVHKEYRALVHGHPADYRGRIDAPLRKDWTRNDPPVYIVDAERGKSAVTHWEVLERLKGFSRVRLCPETGRSHQLRVHMQQLGHPIVGDPIYGPQPPLASLRLCAVVLEFPHPLQGQKLRFEIPEPPEWQDALPTGA